MVIGEGAAVLALEELEHARRRGARIYAELVGFGAAFDPHKSGEGIAQAIRAALNEAGIEPAQIDHVNAHGFSSVASDIWEAKGLAQVFGDCNPSVPVFAGKSYFGSLGAGSGTTELAASLLAQQHGQLPKTLNYDEPDPACPVAVATTPRPIEKPYALKIAFTELGQCAAVVCRKWEQ